MRYFITGLIALIVMVVSIAGFRGDMSRKPPLEIFPDMDRQLKLRPQEPNTFFTNGISSQLPVEGTMGRMNPIPLGDQSVYPFEEHSLITGKIVGTTNFVVLSPMPINRDFLNRGSERYSISCKPCHGIQGDGKGIVSKYGWITVGNLHDARIVAQPDGEIYNTLVHGKNTMGGYGNKISIEDRWAIVAYVRALQLSRLGTIEDVPEDQRAALLN